MAFSTNKVNENKKKQGKQAQPQKKTLCPKFTEKTRSRNETKRKHNPVVEFFSRR